VSSGELAQTVGVAGGGQLGRMIALEARRMGIRVVVLANNQDDPGAQVADEVVVGEIHDPDALTRLAARCDVLTMDTEHVPAQALAALEGVRVLPGPSVFEVVQDRHAQRCFLAASGVPQPRNSPVSDVTSLHAGAAALGFPCVLKARRSGYDGRSQAKIDSPDQAEAAWNSLGNVPAILEEFVDFSMEISVLLARTPSGEVQLYPVAENLHHRRVLYRTQVPATASVDVTQAATALASTIASRLNHVGLLAIEFFVTRDGRVLVNELAPRPHNSGHFTFSNCVTSQFEQHVRAICGLPLGETTLLRPTVMLNLLGELWGAGAPDWTPVLQLPSAKLHLYGKAVAAPGRKMGHVLFSAPTLEEANRLADAAVALLKPHAGESFP
jgi:5-(carboxyamino)imidazole ribonucleotide synthase